MSITFNTAGKKLNYFILLLAVIVLAFTIKFRFIGDDGQAYKRSIEGDGKGYYAYLPAIFIYHDLTFSFFEKDSEKFGFSYSNTFLLNHNEKNVDKYSCGEALLLLPFFLLAMLYSQIFNLPIDGYSGVFQIFCVLGSWFYFTAGLFFTKKFLQQFNLSGKAIGLSLLGITLGSNLLHYTAVESIMSHVFSFSAIACHVYLVKNYFSSPSLKKAILAGLTLGLIILIRPVNGIIIFSYPFLIGNFSFLTQQIKSNSKHFLCAGLFTGLILFIQLIIWKIGTGSFFVFSYKNEGFYFNQVPHLIDYLFGFKRGAFIYSPVLFFSFAGLFALRKEKQKLLQLSLFLLFLFYIHSSWWSWYYGDGFGERPLVDFYVFFALLIAFAFNEVKRIYFPALLLLFSIFLHQVFFYQYSKGIIHQFSMDYEKFWHVFLKTTPDYQNLYKCEPEDFYHPHGTTSIDSVLANLTDTNFIKPDHLSFNKKNIRPEGYYDASESYPFTYEVTTDSSWLFKPRFAEISFDFMQPFPDSAAFGITSYVTMTNKKMETFYFKSSPVVGRIFNTPEVWTHLYDILQIGISEQPGEVIRVFIDNPKNKKFYIKNLKIKIIEAKP